jgi:hypothetical protein
MRTAMNLLSFTRYRKITSMGNRKRLNLKKKLLPDKDTVSVQALQVYTKV